MKLKKKNNIEELEEIDYAIFSLGELQHVINKMEDNIPKDKRTSEYHTYLIELNKLFSIYNSKAGQKIYKLIKL